MTSVKKRAETALGVWYKVYDSEVHSSKQIDPIFEGLEERTVQKLIDLHDQFKQAVSELLDADTSVF